MPRRASGDRRDPLNRGAIAAAAIRILDDGGLDGFTMRRVADALGTGPASLYWHVGSKDGLLDLVFEEVIGEQQVADADPACWQDQLKDVAHTMCATILRHRDIVRISRKAADLYAQLLAAEPHATAERKRELRTEAVKNARQRLLFFDLTISQVSRSRSSTPPSVRTPASHARPEKTTATPTGPPWSARSTT